MKILAISMAFPPLAYPRSIQVARLLKHTKGNTVLFCANEPEARKDETIEPEAEAALADCIRVPVAKSVSSKIIDKFSHRYAHGWWNRRNLGPDGYGGWGEKVISEAVAYLKNRDFQPDVIVTFAQPFTDHLIGLALKRRLNLPWLAHFSDPWADNPFSPYDDATKTLNLGLERSVAENADILAFTSKETVDLFFGKYDPELESKARVLPHCFDSFRPESNFSAKRDKIIIRYLGNFYGRRTPKPLIGAIERIHQDDPKSIDDVAFELVGAGNEEEVKRLSMNLPIGVLSVRSSVAYDESLQLMKDADGLLIIDAPADLSVFLPSKLIDYIGTGRPVFGITPEGAAASLIRELGGRVADPADLEGVYIELINFIDKLKNRRRVDHLEVWGIPEVRDRFKAERIAGDFSKMLAELTGKV